MNKRNVIITTLFLALTATAQSGVSQSVNDYGGETPSDVYAPDYECNCETTSGMTMWAVAMKQKEDAKVLTLTKEMAKGRNANLSAALKSEVAYWEKVGGEINELNAGILELEYWFGGSMGAVAKAFAPLDVSYIRRASMEDDIHCLEGKPNETIKDNIRIDAQVLLASIDSAIVDVGIANIENEMFSEYYGSKNDYMKRLSLCKQNAKQFEADIQNWLSTRNKIESLLSPTARKSYRFHTYKVINSLAVCVKNAVEG